MDLHGYQSVALPKVKDLDGDHRMCPLGVFCVETQKTLDLSGCPNWGVILKCDGIWSSGILLRWPSFTSLECDSAI